MIISIFKRKILSDGQFLLYIWIPLTYCMFDKSPKMFVDHHYAERRRLRAMESGGRLLILRCHELWQTRIGRIWNNELTSFCLVNFTVRGSSLETRISELFPQAMLWRPKPTLSIEFVDIVDLPQLFISPLQLLHGSIVYTQRNTFNSMKPHVFSVGQTNHGQFLLSNGQLTSIKTHQHVTGL